MTNWYPILSFLVLAAEPAPSGGFDLNGIVTLLVGAGGTGALAGIYGLYRMIRKGKLEDEETLIARLNADSKSQGDRADSAESKLADLRMEFDQVAADLRRQRDQARESYSYLRRFLIDEGYYFPADGGPPIYDPHNGGYGAGGHRDQ